MNPGSRPRCPSLATASAIALEVQRRKATAGTRCENRHPRQPGSLRSKQKAMIWEPVNIKRIIFMTSAYAQRETSARTKRFLLRASHESFAIESEKWWPPKSSVTAKTTGTTNKIPIVNSSALSIRIMLIPHLP